MYKHPVQAVTTLPVFRSRSWVINRTKHSTDEKGGGCPGSMFKPFHGLSPHTTPDSTCPANLIVRSHAPVIFVTFCLGCPLRKKRSAKRFPQIYRSPVFRIHFMLAVTRMYEESDSVLIPTFAVRAGGTGGPVVNGPMQQTTGQRPIEKSPSQPCDVVLCRCS